VRVSCKQDVQVPRRELGLGSRPHTQVYRIGAEVEDDVEGDGEGSEDFHGLQRCCSRVEHVGECCTVDSCTRGTRGWERGGVRRRPGWAWRVFGRRLREIWGAKLGEEDLPALPPLGSGVSVCDC
jgi:hypothetical protein